MEYNSVSEAAKKWVISKTRVQKRSKENGILGIEKFSYMCLISKDAAKPVNCRLKHKKRTIANSQER